MFHGPTRHVSSVPSQPGFLAIVIRNKRREWQLLHLTGHPNLQQAALDETLHGLWLSSLLQADPAGEEAFAYAWLPMRAWKKPQPTLQAALDQVDASIAPEVKRQIKYYTANAEDRRLRGDDAVPF